MFLLVLRSCQTAACESPDARPTEGVRSSFPSTGSAPHEDLCLRVRLPRCCLVCNNELGFHIRVESVSQGERTGEGEGGVRVFCLYHIRLNDPFVSVGIPPPTIELIAKWMFGLLLRLNGFHAVCIPHLTA